MDPDIDQRTERVRIIKTFMHTCDILSGEESQNKILVDDLIFNLQLQHLQPEQIKFAFDRVMEWGRIYEVMPGIFANTISRSAETQEWKPWSMSSDEEIPNEDDDIPEEKDISIEDDDIPTEED
jgi:hypothetical protein